MKTDDLQSQPVEFVEQLGIVGSYISRRESPVLEAATAKAIEDAVRDLIQSRYLYQKIDVDLDPMIAAVRKNISTPEGKSVTGGAMVDWSKKLPDRLNALRAETQKRPWYARTRNRADDPQIARIQQAAGGGTQPLGTPVENMAINFFLPSVQMLCAGKCKQTTTFSAHVSSTPFSLETLYPRQGKNGIEQIFMPVYRCEMCCDRVFTALIHRMGPRLHLAGFAPRRDVPLAEKLPDSLNPILSDAEQAIAEGDVFAAFYHLRTMLEHYLKLRLGLAILEQVRGDTLIERHYENLPANLRGALPPILAAWQKLSEYLHTRTGDADDYRVQKAVICKHIAAVDLLAGK